MYASQTNCFHNQDFYWHSCSYSSNEWQEALWRYSVNIQLHFFLHCSFTVMPWTFKYNHSTLKHRTRDVKLAKFPLSNFQQSVIRLLVYINTALVLFPLLQTQFAVYYYFKWKYNNKTRTTLPILNRDMKLLLTKALLRFHDLSIIAPHKFLHPLSHWTFFYFYINAKCSMLIA